MSLRITVATANILRDLRWGNALKSLKTVLAESPDIVVLQEWGLVRLPMLRKTGDVRLVPGPEVPGNGKYVWGAGTLGGVAVGARADRLELEDSHLVRLALPERAERPQRPLGVEPPRFAVAVSYASRDDGTTIGMLGYHLSPGVQSVATGQYFADRPVMVSRHQREVARVEQELVRMRSSHDAVFAAGDANFDGLRLAGQTSAWAGRENEPGTLGDHGRKVDDIHSPVAALTVRQLPILSDHRAVLATYELG